MVGIVGIEGMLGNGGRVTFGAEGKFGKLGSGGSVPRFGKDGWVVGKFGSVGCGRLGIEGNDGIAVPGRVGNC